MSLLSLGDQLSISTINRDTKEINRLIDLGANINFDGGYAVRMALLSRNLEIIKLFVENGANIRDHGGYALLGALNDGGEIMEYLLSVLDPEYIFTELPGFIKYLPDKCSHYKMMNKFGVFDV